MKQETKFEIQDPRWNCPECGHNWVVGNSRQVCEDGCEMWYECAKCGYNPSPDDQVETVMGWDESLHGYALEAYRDNHPAGKAIYAEIEAHKAKAAS